MSIFTKKEENTPYDTLKERFDGYNTSLAAAQETLEAAMSKRNDAKADMEAAADEDDPAAFAVAKASLAEAETAIEMEELRIERIKTKGAVSKAEADAACIYYKRWLHEVNVEAAKKICDLIDQIADIDKAALTEANNIAMQYAGVLRLLDRVNDISMETGAPSRVHGILGNSMNLLGTAGGWGNSPKSQLYLLAGRKV